jgi:ketosteroid isomerase-like protein
MRTVKHWWLLLVSACWVLAAHATASPADEAALREIKVSLWPRAYFTQDTRLLGQILADEFQMYDDSGARSTKAEELAWIAKNKPGYDSLSFVIERLEIFNGDMAVVAGTGTIKGKDPEGAYSGTYKSTNIFVKRHGQWRAVASHVSGWKRSAT